MLADVIQSTRCDARGESRRGRPSLARQRHEVIVAEVRRRGSVRVSELATLLEVSDMTVRRDLDLLDEAGLIVKVHGGATVRDEHSTDEPGFEAKSLAQHGREARHRRIGGRAHRSQRAARSGSPPAPPRGSSPPNSSTSPNLTVVTNTVRVADVLHPLRRSRSHGRARSAGCARRPTRSSARCRWHALRSLHLDTVFMGVHGMQRARRLHARRTCWRPTPTARSSMPPSELVVLADHTKWERDRAQHDRRARRRDRGITDDGLSEHAPGRAARPRRARRDPVRPADFHRPRRTDHRR